MEVERLATGFPAAESDGENEVVMGGAAAPAQEFGTEGCGGVVPDGDFEGALFEEDAEVGEEVVAGDVVGAVGDGDALAAGDDDAEGMDAEPGGVEHVADGAADAGGVDVDFGAVLAEEVDDGANAVDDVGVGGVEREALEVTDDDAHAGMVGEGVES